MKKSIHKKVVRIIKKKHFSCKSPIIHFYCQLTKAIENTSKNRSSKFLMKAWPR